MFFAPDRVLRCSRAASREAGTRGGLPPPGRPTLVRASMSVGGGQGSVAFGLALDMANLGLHAAATGELPHQQLQRRERAYEVALARLVSEGVIAKVEYKGESVFGIPASGL